MAVDNLDAGAALTPEMIENFRDAFQSIAWTVDETLNGVEYEAEVALGAEGGAA